MTDENAGTEVVAPKGPPKSIVPAKYAGKYKEGGGDALAKFIEAQCKTPEGFDYNKFFHLCLANGLPADKVLHYQDQVSEKRNGSQGRARMTLRNMLASIVRKNKSIKDLDGADHALDLPKPLLTGAALIFDAAKAAKEKEAKSPEAA